MLTKKTKMGINALLILFSMMILSILFLIIGGTNRSILLIGMGISITTVIESIVSIVGMLIIYTQDKESEKE